MLRRIALGLADPIVADRFRLMAHAAFSIAGILILVILCPWLLGRPPREAPMLIGLITLAAGYAAACLYCAMRSPAFYQRWVLSEPEGS